MKVFKFSQLFLFKIILLQLGVEASSNKQIGPTGKDSVHNSHMIWFNWFDFFPEIQTECGDLCVGAWRTCVSPRNVHWNSWTSLNFFSAMWTTPECLHHWRQPWKSLVCHQCGSNHQGIQRLGLVWYFGYESFPDIILLIYIPRFHDSFPANCTCMTEAKKSCVDFQYNVSSEVVTLA